MTTPRRLVLRSTTVCASALGALVAAGSLAPAHADVPVGWSDPAPVNLFHAVLLLGGVPLLLAVIIVALFYGPALARGERVAPGSAPVVDQWLGGPRQGIRELAGPDSDNSQAGGARGSW